MILLGGHTLLYTSFVLNCSYKCNNGVSMTEKLKKNTPPMPLRGMQMSMQGRASKWDKTMEPEGLMRTKAPFVEGTIENRLRITIDGRNALSAIGKKLSGRDPEERMWAARTLLSIVQTDGHLCSFLRESGGSAAMSFRRDLDRAFSKGDKELNPVLREVRRRVYTVPKPRHCMIIKVEELEAHMKKRNSPDDSNSD